MSIEHTRIVSPHIEKTGGISLLNFFNEFYGPENVFYYIKEVGFVRSDENPITKRINPKAEKIKSLLLTNPLSRKLYPLMRKFLYSVAPPVGQQEIPEEFSIIHGHFVPSDVPIVDASWVTVFREPLARTVSHYNFMIEEYKKGIQQPEWFDPHMSFEQYALDPHVVNFQSNRIGPGGIDQFTHVGVTESLQEYCRYFDPQDTVPINWLNRTNIIKESGDFNNGFVEEYYRQNAADVDLYQSALARVNAR